MRAKIKEKREVAKGTLMVVFDLLGQEVDFHPGQYFWVTLLDPPYDDEKGPRRHISVVTSPNDRGVLGLCTRLRDSAFKRSLAELPVGTDVELQQLERELADFRLVATMTKDPEWEGETRRIDGDLLRDHLGEDLRAFSYM